MGTGQFNRMKAAVLKDTNGSPDEQKEELVQTIIRAFGDPDKWPLTDAERITFIKTLYKRCRTIRDTERAISDSTI